MSNMHNAMTTWLKSECVGSGTKTLIIDASFHKIFDGIIQDFDPEALAPDFEQALLILSKYEVDGTVAKSDAGRIREVLNDIRNRYDYFYNAVNFNRLVDELQTGQQKVEHEGMDVITRDLTSALEEVDVYTMELIAKCQCGGQP